MRHGNLNFEMCFRFCHRCYSLILQTLRVLTEIGYKHDKTTQVVKATLINDLTFRMPQQAHK